MFDFGAYFRGLLTILGIWSAFMLLLYFLSRGRPGKHLHGSLKGHAPQNPPTHRAIKNETNVYLGGDGKWHLKENPDNGVTRADDLGYTKFIGPREFDSLPGEEFADHRGNTCKWLD